MALYFQQEPVTIFCSSAWDFAKAKGETTVIARFRAGDGSLLFVPADEFDGDTLQIVGEIDPFARWRRNWVSSCALGSRLDTPQFRFFDACVHIECTRICSPTKLKSGS